MMFIFLETVIKNYIFKGDMTWEKIDQKINNLFEPRFYHTTCIYGEKLCVFGGCTS